MQRGRRRRASLAAVFLFLAKRGPHSHTYLAISHKVLHFFPTPSALPCARITVSVELNFFSLFSSLSCTHNPFCIETVRARRFLPPFFASADRQESERKQQRLSRCCFSFAQKSPGAEKCEKYTGKTRKNVKNIPQKLKKTWKPASHRHFIYVMIEVDFQQGV